MEFDYPSSVTSDQPTANTFNTSTTNRSRIGGAVTHAAGKMMNGAMGLLDVDGVMRRIDVNDMMLRVDWNDVIDEIDWNNLLEHVDMDALMHRIDVNAVMERIDVNAVIERSNLQAIIARSTSGICLMALDSFRALCIKSDQLLQRMGRCADCCFCYPDYAKWTLPPLPTVTPIKRRKDRHKDRALRRAMACPRKSTHLAIAVQGRCAGTCSRFIAFAIDKGLVIGFTFLIVLIVARLVDLAENTLDEAALADSEATTANATEVPEADGFVIGDGQVSVQERLFFAVVLPTVLVGVLGFLFDAAFLSVTGRTFGKMIMGLMIVDSREGSVQHLSVCQAIIRAALLNTGLFTVMGAMLSLVRDDRRGINDLIVGTTVIYAWDAKRYRLAEEENTRDMPFGDLESNANNNTRRSSFFAAAAAGFRNRRQGVHHGKPGGMLAGSTRMETRIVTVPVMDDGFDT